MRETTTEACDQRCVAQLIVASATQSAADRCAAVQQPVQSPADREPADPGNGGRDGAW
jgi:hypothetical protein